ncbi:hypothetical protein D1872_286030 [compost metagenome]
MGGAISGTMGLRPVVCAGCTLGAEASCTYSFSARTDAGDHASTFVHAGSTRSARRASECFAIFDWHSRRLIIQKTGFR